MSAQLLSPTLAERGTRDAAEGPGAAAAASPPPPPPKAQPAGFDETAHRLFGRAASRPILTGVPEIDEGAAAGGSGGGLRPGQVLEITGLSQSGKTELLYRIALGAALPRQWRCVELGGQEAVVVFIDLDFRFNAGRFIELLEQRVVEAVAAARRSGRREEEEDADGDDAATPLEDAASFLATPEYEALRADVFNRVLVTQCQTFAELLAAVRYVPRVIAEARRHGALAQVLLIDNVSAFYWMQKWERQLSKFDAFVALLRAVMDEAKLPLVVTKQVLFLGGDPQRRPNDYLGRNWAAAVTHRILLPPPDSLAPLGAQAEPHP